MVETTLPTISDFIPEIICLGVDCLVCGILYTAYLVTNRSISEISKAANFDLEKKVVSHFLQLSFIPNLNKTSNVNM